MSKSAKSSNDATSLTPSREQQRDSSTPGDAGSTGRRDFLIRGASTGFLGALTGLGATSSANAASAQGITAQGPHHRAARQGIHAPMTSDARSTLDLQRRTEMCRGYANAAQLAPRPETNGDEQRYRQQRYYASFSKTLPCNRYGEVEPSAFEALTKAMESTKNTDFDAISLAPGATLKLANPQGALKYQSCGLDSHQIRMDAPHTFHSAAMAGEMVEVYWQAITRDIPYTNYPESSTIAAAVTDINQLSYAPAHRSHLITTPGNLFRGESFGDLQGPYISQFLWQNYFFGQKNIDQRYPLPTPRRNYMKDLPEWLDVQRGSPRRESSFTGQYRYIHNNRSLAAYVHSDALFQAYLQAALILLGYGPRALARNNPYRNSTNQGGFVSHGAPNILDLVARAAQAALHAAWYQKWSVHRLLRPEVTGARVHFHMKGERQYNIHEDLLNSRALEYVHSRQGNYLLSQAYPEGSPTHPSYPAGHACVAGACTTVLKAMFNEEHVIENPVVANQDGSRLLSYQGVMPLSVGDELNKLASNMSLGRDAAGVHYRQDGVHGMLVGEKVAIALLQEQSTSCFESEFEGYQFRKFSGDRIEIQNGEVIA